MLCEGSLRRPGLRLAAHAGEERFRLRRCVASRLAASQASRRQTTRRSSRSVPAKARARSRAMPRHSGHLLCRPLGMSRSTGSTVGFMWKCANGFISGPWGSYSADGSSTKGKPRWGMDEVFGSLSRFEVIMCERRAEAGPCDERGLPKFLFDGESFWERAWNGRLVHVPATITPESGWQHRRGCGCELCRLAAAA
jgi:hypothetical protein